MYKIVGVNFKEGKLDNGTPWQNYYLYCITDSMEVVSGYGVETIKVKPAVFEGFMKNKGVDDIKKVINLEVNPLYDKYGKIQVL